jgi:hypothetical protein
MLSGPLKKMMYSIYTRWFKYDGDYLCVNKSQFVPVIFEPPCILQYDRRTWAMTNQMESSLEA